MLSLCDAVAGSLSPSPLGRKITPRTGIPLAHSGIWVRSGAWFLQEPACAHQIPAASAACIAASVSSDPPSTELEAALLEICRTIHESGLPYAVVGGLATAVWGEPRATLDVDVTVWAEESEIPPLLDQLKEQFTILVPDPSDFIAQTRVLPLQSTGKVRIDLIFGLLPFEEAATSRAVGVEVAGEQVRFCTAEDLILMKIVSERPRDLEDVRSVILRQRSLDFEYLEPRIRELSELLERPEILDSFRQWLEESRNQGT